VSIKTKKDKLYPELKVGDKVKIKRKKLKGENKPLFER